jgi:hypothetical protein
LNVRASLSSLGAFDPLDRSGGNEVSVWVYLPHLGSAFALVASHDSSALWEDILRKMKGTPYLPLLID